MKSVQTSPDAFELRDMLEELLGELKKTTIVDVTHQLFPLMDRAENMLARFVVCATSGEERRETEDDKERS